MAVNIHNLIASINPGVFCEPFIEEEGKRVDLREKVKKLVKEKGYLAAAEVAKPKESSAMDFDERIPYISPFKLAGIKNPIEKHYLSYDSSGQNLEPVYFWILDNLYQEYRDMKKVDKLIDNFVSSPGSGHFSEMGLKEFKIRLDLYEELKSSKSEEKNSAMLSLKQIWMDTVDAKRGNTSIKALTLGGQSYFVTLIDAFMASDSLKVVDKLDLNDRVKRLLQQRVGEFLKWVEESEKELRKRYEIERTYLKSQVT